LKPHSYDLIGEVEEGGLEASTLAYEQSFRARQRS
jgi:hypothetical protein